jgi:hypothetical protein
MRYCGNRLKARAFRRRRKAPARGPTSEGQARSDAVTAPA